jgi:hypothetical protein
MNYGLGSYGLGSFEEVSVAHKVVIQWNPSPDAANIAGYAVYRIKLSPVSLLMTFNRLTDGYLTTALSYTDTTVLSGWTYIYFVTAWQSLHGAMSHPSNIVSVNIP